MFPRGEINVQEDGNSWEQQGGNTWEAAGVTFYVVLLGLKRAWWGEVEESKEPQSKCKHERKGPFGKGKMSRGREGFESLSYCSVLYTTEDFPLF